MKGLAIVVLAVIVATVVARPEEKYTSKYDNVNLNDIISNKRLLKNYVHCLLGKGKCTPDGQELKKVLPDALKTDCQKCSQKQKDGAEIILRHMVKHEPEWYAELEKEYDPEGIYKKKIDDELKQTEDKPKEEKPKEEKPKEEAPKEEKPKDQKP